MIKMFEQYRRFCLKTDCKCQMQLSGSNLVQNNSESGWLQEEKVLPMQTYLLPQQPEQ